MQSRQELALFQNSLAQEFLKRGKADALAKYLKVSDKRLMSGMTAEEIDAVRKRAAEAFEDLND